MYYPLINTYIPPGIDKFILHSCPKLRKVIEMYKDLTTECDYSSSSDSGVSEVVMEVSSPPASQDVDVNATELHTEEGLNSEDDNVAPDVIEVPKVLGKWNLDC